MKVYIAEGEFEVDYREIDGFPGYAIGSDGSVWSRKIGGSRSYRLSDAWSKKKLQISNEGYYCVDLWRNGKRHHKYVHILLAETFIGPAPPGCEVRHLNGVRLDIRLDNLEWGTRIQNIEDSIRHGTKPRGENHKSHKMTAGQVREARILRRQGMTLREIGEIVGASFGSVGHAVRGSTWAWMD